MNNSDIQILTSYLSHRTCFSPQGYIATLLNSNLYKNILELCTSYVITQIINCVKLLHLAPKRSFSCKLEREFFAVTERGWFNVKKLSAVNS